MVHRNPDRNVLASLEKDARTMSGDLRRVLFCFLSDPYQPIEREQRLTRRALEILAKYDLRSQVLTKGDGDLIVEDLDLMKASGTHLGVTLCFTDDSSRLHWEPGASSVKSRLDLLKTAHNMGIFTWVSLEPVINPIQALDVIRMAHEHVDFWKIGKLNHMKDHEKTVDWGRFLVEVETLLSGVSPSVL